NTETSDSHVTNALSLTPPEAVPILLPRHLPVAGSRPAPVLLLSSEHITTHQLFIGHSSWRRPADVKRRRVRRARSLQVQSRCVPKTVTRARRASLRTQPPR